MADNPADEVFGVREFDIAPYRQGVIDALSDHGRRMADKPKTIGEKRISRDEFFYGSAPPKKSDYNDRAKRWMARQGWEYERVDHFDARTTRHHDLLGMFDYLAFTGSGETVGVQITSIGQVSVRKQKILREPKLAWTRKAGWKVLVLGFGDDREVRELWI